MKKFKPIIIIISIVSLIIVATPLIVGIFPWLMIGIGIPLSPNPPKPKITYGEFPFQLTYEINGETKVIKDTLICEFAGYEQWGEAGKYRKWKSYLKSGKKRITLLKVDNTLELFFDVDDPEFFMNDPQHGRAGKTFDYDPTLIDCLKRVNGNHLAGSAIPASEAWEKYKLKILDWKYTPPIKNSFK